MNQIETFFFDQTLATEFSMVFEKYQWTVLHHKEEQTSLDGEGNPKMIFIKEEEKTAQTIELLLSIKNKRTFIWVLAEESLSMRMMYMKLGADGALKLADNNTIEEFALFTTNLYKKITNVGEGSNQESELVSYQEKIQLNLQNFSMVIEGKEIYFTKSEYKLIDFLLDHASETVSYQELVNHLWGKKEEAKLLGEKRKYRIANLVFHIRKKLNQEGLKKKYIQTIRSRGYRIVV
ncbi:winged helix-turn-helix domain-containing protein [Enterococcus sp. AZ126]|uniref:winged helix-turn-helix domain-containing protein n=1 Tax=Enterococcus sp. AZ126 TaxID=2774635 RepID=UPI003F1FE936